MRAPGIFRRGGRQEGRTWPMLALLLMVVLVAAGCVLWFLGEAMRNERTALRATLEEAYRGHLVLLQTRLVEGWTGNLARMDGRGAGAEKFARCVREGLAESVICLDATGGVAYPGVGVGGVESPGVAGIQERLRMLAKAGDAARLGRFVLGEFGDSDGRVDAEGNLVAANAELLAVEMGKRNDPEFVTIEERLARRVEDYGTGGMPAAQRRFILHALPEAEPGRGLEFPLMGAEDLAARFLDGGGTIARTAGLRVTELPGIWSAAAPDGSAVGLFTTAGLQKKMGEIIRDPSLPMGMRLKIEAPAEEAMNDASVLAAVPAGVAFPGWRLAVFIDDPGRFDREADRRVKFLVSVACVVIGAISMLAILIARSFWRQARVARLKNDLVATVSHELKTPLTAMRALVETLMDTERLDEATTREYLRMIATENARLSRLIENFLAFSRLERNKFAFDFKPVRPEEVVAAAVTAFGARARALESRVEGELPRIHGDLDALATALLNLLDNAWKYTGEEKHIRVAASAENGSVRFAVADNGIGLSARESRQVFGRFYQSDQRLARTAGGCGLGLSIVKSIVESHRGEVSVTSEPGVGSTFTMEIPAMARSTA